MKHRFRQLAEQSEKRNPSGISSRLRAGSYSDLKNPKFATIVYFTFPRTPQQRVLLFEGSALLIPSCISDEDLVSRKTYSEPILGRDVLLYERITKLPQSCIDRILLLPICFTQLPEIPEEAEEESVKPWNLY